MQWLGLVLDPGFGPVRALGRRDQDLSEEIGTIFPLQGTSRNDRADEEHGIDKQSSIEKCLELGDR